MSNNPDKSKNYDYTSTDRARRRRATLNQIAADLGFDSWGKFETAVINGTVEIMISRIENNTEE